MTRCAAKKTARTAGNGCFSALPNKKKDTLHVQDVPKVGSPLSGLKRCFVRPAYQALDPWHPGEPQVLVVALKFSVLTTFVAPFMCVAAVTAVEL